MEAALLIDESYGKVHGALVNFFHIPDEFLSVRVRAGLGPKHSWDSLPEMSGFCLEGILDFAPKRRSNATGILLTKDIILSQIGIRLLGISSQELGLQAKQKMKYGFGLFGTIFISVSGSTVPLELDFDVSEIGNLVQIKAGLTGGIWQNVFGSGLTVSVIWFPEDGSLLIYCA